MVKKKNGKVKYDLSALKLNELIMVYENINSFLKALESKKIIDKTKVNQDE